MSSPLKPTDIKVDYWSHSPMVNQNPTCVRLTHIPTGTIVIADDHKSVYQNLNLAYARLEDIMGTKIV